MVLSKKFSQFATAAQNNSDQKVVGLEGGVNVQSARFLSWTTAGRPSLPFNGLLGLNTTLEAYEFYNSVSMAWEQLGNAEAHDATYILQVPDTLLPNAQALSLLATGILKSTTTTGVVSISAPLTSIDGLTTAANEMLYTTAADTYATTPLTAFARTLLDDANAATMRTTLGLGTAAVKDATDNAENLVVSAKGAFTVGHLLVAADAFGTAQDGGVPFGGGTVTQIDTGTGLTGGPITTTGTIELIVPVALNLGGTNAALVASNGGVVYSTATALAILAGTPTANLPLLSGISSAPSWGAFALNLGGDLTTAGAFTTSGAFAVTQTYTGITNVTFPTSGTLATTAQLPTLPLSLADGGTNANLTANNGGIVYSTATAMAILAGTATANQALLSGASGAPSWSTATYPTTTTINQLLYSSANNTITGLATANSAILITSAGGVPSFQTTIPAFTTSSITFNPSTSGIVGTQTNDNATAGFVGEVISSLVPFGSAVALTTSITADVTSISLTAGDWDVSGLLAFSPGGGTLASSYAGGISLTSATFGALALTEPRTAFNGMSYGAGAPQTFNTGMARISLAATTTVYLIASASFTVSTNSVYGFIIARRVR